LANHDCSWPRSIHGKYTRIRETFHGTKTEARRRRDELRFEVANGTHVRADDLVATYLTGWIAKSETRGGIRAKVAYTYAGYVRREVAPRIGRMRLDAVRPAHIQRVIDEALAGGLAPRSVTQIARIMHAAFRDAAQLGVLRANPSDGVKLPRVRKTTVATPSPTDVGRLLDEIDQEYRAPLAVTAGTGLRRGEVLALTWDGVDLEGVRPAIGVDGTLQRVPGVGLVIEPPKTDRSRRKVPLSGTLVAMLRRVRKEQNTRRLIAGDAWLPGDYVFDRGDGRPIDPDAFGKAYRIARERCGLEAVRLHDLRHGFATLLVTDHADARVVSDVLGHATVAFTLQTYFHPDKDAAADAVAKAERLLGWA
jgi:integrase